MKKWQKKESKDADIFNGRRTPKSGGFWFFPGDVKSDDFLIDSKTTDKKSFSITANMWEKIEGEALKSRRIPILSILLTNEGTELVCLDKNDFIELIKKKDV